MGQLPVAKVKLPELALRDTIVAIDGSESENAKYYKWMPIQLAIDSDNCRASDANTNLYISAKPGTYDFVLSVSNEEGLDSVKFSITIQDNEDQPTPNDPNRPKTSLWVGRTKLQMDSISSR